MSVVLECFEVVGSVPRAPPRRPLLWRTCPALTFFLGPGLWDFRVIYSWGAGFLASPTDRERKGGLSLARGFEGRACISSNMSDLCTGGNREPQFPGLPQLPTWLCDPLPLWAAAPFPPQNTALLGQERHFRFLLARLHLLTDRSLRPMAGCPPGGREDRQAAWAGRGGLGRWPCLTAGIPQGHQRGSRPSSA